MEDVDICIRKMKSVFTTPEQLDAMVIPSADEVNEVKSGRSENS